LKRLYVLAFIAFAAAAIIWVSAAVFRSPSVEIICPGDVVGGTAPVEVHVNLPSPTGVEFCVDGEVVCAWKSPPYVWVWDTSAFNDGDHRLEVVVHAGNGVTRCERTVKVDNSPPTCTIIQPSNVARGKVTMLVAAEDSVGVGRVEFYVDGVLVHVCSSPPYEYASWDTGLSADGIHAIKVVAYDLAFNHASQSALILVDNTPPSVTITAPENNTYLNRETLWLNGTVLEVNKGCSTPEIDVDGFALFHWNPSTGEFSFRSCVPLTEGSHSATVSFRDLLGNVGCATAHFTVDLTSPRVHIVAPSNGSFVSKTLLIHAEVEEANPYSCTVTVDGEEVWSGTGEYAWNTSVFPDGAHTLTVAAEDAAGNTGSGSVAIFIDNTPPQCEVNLTESSTVKGTLEVAADARDNMGVERVEFHVDGALIHAASRAPYIWRWNTTHFTDGQHVLRVAVYDFAGNVAEEKRSLTVDNTPPSVTEPQLKAESSEVSVSVEAADNASGVAAAVFRYRTETSDWTSLNMTLIDGKWVAKFNLNDSDAAVTYYVQVFDQAWNVYETQPATYIVKENLVPPSTPPSWRFISIILMALIGLLLVGVVVKGFGALARAISSFFRK
jgi:hypothetical protein